jgi:hypothetical protein
VPTFATSAAFVRIVCDSSMRMYKEISLTGVTRTLLGIRFACDDGTLDKGQSEWESSIDSGHLINAVRHAIPGQEPTNLSPSPSPFTYFRTLYPRTTDHDFKLVISRIMVSGRRWCSGKDVSATLRQSLTSRFRPTDEPQLKHSPLKKYMMVNVKKAP